MDQTTQQHQGNFIGFARRDKTNKDRKPNFDGRIAIPGTDREFRMALWATTDKNGKVMFSGRSADISTSDSALDQIEAMAGAGKGARDLEENGFELRPGQIVLFSNGYKDAENPNRPDYYGRWNPGTGDKPVAISVWASKSRQGNALLAGKTQYAISKNVALDDGTMVDRETGELLPETTQTSGRSRRAGAGR